MSIPAGDLKDIFRPFRQRAMRSKSGWDLIAGNMQSDTNSSNLKRTMTSKRNQNESKKLVAIWTNTGQPSPTMRHIVLPSCGKNRNHPLKLKCKPFMAHFLPH
jgi:hypothetical protein